MQRLPHNHYKKSQHDELKTLFLRGFISLGFFLILIIAFPNEGVAEQTSIQQLIDEATEGDTIHIPGGTYEEAIIIDQPLTLIGDETVQFNIKDHKPAITVQADDVTIQHISINYHSDDPEQAALIIESNDSHINHVQIKTEQKGILLDGAHGNVIEHIKLRGNKKIPFQSRQRGIDLWESDHNTIRYTDIAYVEDGIYIEKSSNNLVHDNIASNSRYGYHLMFTKDTELFANESYENISGMMIMGTNRTKAYENIITFNQKNVQSLGLLLFDVKDASIERNEIAHNRIGIFVESASKNNITENDINNNFIGLQFKQAEENIIYKNSFSANVVQGQAEESMANETNSNYWGNHIGLDMDGDGLSNLAYKIDPFYLHLTNEYPAYRLLFQSPGFIFLENMIHTPVEQQLVDQSPFMKDPLVQESSSSQMNLLVVIISSMLFILSLFIIYMGVKH